MIFKYTKSTYLLLFFYSCFQLVSCGQSIKKGKTIPNPIDTSLTIGADRINLYLPDLKNKTIAIVANQTSITNIKGKSTHLVDFLHQQSDITVKTVFAPEHGFRGKADAGETVVDGIDGKTGIPIVSLYGKNKKPTATQLKNIEVVVFDIQDVGARFYTYISTLHYVMEACAEMKIPVVLLDRPNPNGHYVDGPVLTSKHKSFVGMHPVPVVYGMTIGEYGKMINGEKWLDKKLTCDLKVIPLKNYDRNEPYSLPVKPSPNLPNDKAINLYPSLCFFEGTVISVGRGTDHQFQVIGSPIFKKIDNKTYSFTPIPNEGAKKPKHKGLKCYGNDLRNENTISKLTLSWLIDYYHTYKGLSKEKVFFNSFFTKLAGTEKLQQQITSGITEANIRKSWQPDLNTFKKIRRKYLIY